MKNCIVKNPDFLKKQEYVVFNIRVSKNQSFIFKSWCKDNRVLMRDTFSNCIEEINKNPIQINGNSTKTSKLGAICIRGSKEDKKALSAYCVAHKVNIGDVIFSILNELVGGKL